MSTPSFPHRNWGEPPWRIDFTPSSQRASVPEVLDLAVIGGGFTGLAAAAWLRQMAPDKSVAVFEAAKIGAGASGRTGGMALGETAAGDLPGLGDVLAGFTDILSQLGVHCDQQLHGAWEISRKRADALPSFPISWKDSGTLRVVNEVPGGTIDPGKLVTGLAQAAERRGAIILEDHAVEQVRWSEPLGIALRGHAPGSAEIFARKIIFATNALSLDLVGLGHGMHPRLTLAVATGPLREEQLQAIGLAGRKPFYTVDFPYLWGRVRLDNSVIFGAGLVQSPDSDDLEQVDISAEEPARTFALLERRVRGLHPELASIPFTHRWGGPIMFQDTWTPIFGWHPRSEGKRNAILICAYAGHGVALSSYLGRWAAEALLGGRELPEWGAVPV
jgi:glycine/D-amino acid oxidase-like deaminating enzyme